MVVFKKVATSWNAFAGDIVVKSRDAINYIKRNII